MIFNILLNYGCKEKHFYAILCILPFPFIHTNNKNKQDDVKENRRGFSTSEREKKIWPFIG